MANSRVSPWAPDPERIPYITRDEMIEVDRAMMTDYGIGMIQMMENAGSHLASLARHRFLDGDPTGRPVVILAGRGGNGGGALVCARYLANWGARVQVVLTRAADDFSGVPARQLSILERMRVAVHDGGRGGAIEVAAMHGPALIVDGLIGYGLVGAPRGVTADLIRWANDQAVPTLALDTPSGLDVTSGVAHSPTVQAAATMTLALPKVGFRAAEAAAWIGELYLADISVPPTLYLELGITATLPRVFTQHVIVRLR